MTTSEAPEQTVTGELHYLAPESTVLRRFTAPGNSVNTGTYRGYQMPISNGRPVSGQFTLDRNGFAITGHRSAVTDFTDSGEVNRVYPGEVAEFVKSYTGADRVATLGWTLRRAADPGENASQPQAALVHDDFSVNGARGRAEAAYASHFPGAPATTGRSSPACGGCSARRRRTGRWPSATTRSVGPDEGLDNRLYFVDKIPDDLYADLPEDAQAPAASSSTTAPATSGGTSPA